MQAIIRETLASALLKLPALVDAYQQRDPLFATQAIHWLGELEKAMQQLRLPLAAMLAGERAKVLAVNDGYRDPLLPGERLSSRKAQAATASLALNRAQDEARRLIAGIDAQFDLWREKLAQFLAIATQKTPIPLPPTEPREAWLAAVWRQLDVNGDTQGMYRYLNAALPASDRLYLLNELLTNLLGV